MYLLVGLGNPGPKYAKNRHNAGFQVMDALVSAQRLGPERQKFNGLIAEGNIGPHRVAALKPQTFYNESGNSIAAAARFYKISADAIIVFHDEIDLAPGKFRVKLGGGLAGNNGLRSTAAHLGPDFWRVRIGVGHPGHKDAVMPHVLGDFSKAEREGWFDDLAEKLARHLEILLPPSEETGNKYMSAVTQPPKALPRPTARDEPPAATGNAAPSPATSPFADALKGLRPDKS